MLGRLFGVAAILLVALSTAWADVREIGSAGKSTDTDFAGYANRDVSDPWLEALLRKTWLEIWFEMLRDEIFVDTSDYLNDELGVALRRLMLPNQDSGGLQLSKNAAPVASGCDSVSSSASVECEIASALLSTGWSNPDSAPALSTGWSDPGSPPASGGFPFGALGAFGGGAFPRPGDISAAEYQRLAEALAEGALYGRCCGSDSQPEASLSDSSPPVGSQFQPLIGQLDGQSRGAFSIPEPSIPAMLLMGLCALALAAKTGTSRSRAA